ncbi:MAG: phosphopantetheine adenylyltransferase [Candidatus Hadarchaeales archaeon]
MKNNNIKYKKVVVGGTFDYFHDGHKTLLRKAYEIGERVCLGISSDKMAELLQKDSAGVAPLAVRLLAVLHFLRENDWLGRTEITILEDPFGPAVDDPEAEAIVVSPETKCRAKEINEKRQKNNLPPLQIVEIPFVLAEDGKPISSIRIRYGEIDEHGKLIKQTRVG